MISFKIRTIPNPLKVVLSLHHSFIFTKFRTLLVSCLETLGHINLHPCPHIPDLTYPPSPIDPCPSSICTLLPRTFTSFYCMFKGYSRIGSQKTKKQFWSELKEGRVSYRWMGIYLKGIIKTHPHRVKIWVSYP